MGDRVKYFLEKDPVTINKNVSISSMLNYISPTTIQSKQLNWYTINTQVYQGSDATTIQHRELVHNFKKIGYNRFLKDYGHNLHQVHGEGYFKVPKLMTN